MPCLLSLTAQYAHAAMVRSRRSVRAYRPSPVPPSLLRGILETARLAPSGANLQPGRFIAIQGTVRQHLCDELVQSWQQGRQEVEDYGYFPNPMPKTLRRRQVAAAQALYSALVIPREDRAGRNGQFERNFRFFDAPVALIITIENDFGSGGYMDLGMSIYGLMLAAQSHGLSTCAIGAMASFPGLIRRHLGLDERTHIVCGMAMGYADLEAPVNQTQTTRCSLDEYFRTIG
jgi:nitroreductase